MFDKFALLGFGPGGWGWALLQGAANTISVALATLPFGLALGLIIALWKRSDSMLLRSLATIYTTVFRGVPELLTLYIIYFGIQVLVQKAWSGFSIPPFVAGMVALGMVLAAFSSEVWVGALNSIQKGQREAASALGLSKAQAFRLVVFPQLIRVALPGLGNNWMVLLKETSLISVITLQDIMFIATRANVVTKEPFLFFGTAMLLYFFFSLVSAWGIGKLEQRTNRGFAAFGGATR
ncbi:Amino acid ABC transporter membrane protein 1, PAAT family [Bosea sp. 62]|uniref:ABC transporter permease n=1 Tax=unclassified Bosea (in: a-proteobacteria) TaxID=2653178 RepID=UPI00125C5C2C|nr:MULTISPECIES: ABC transporter permease subunit [unclassified Bosea (in: a-proteobacteria)]CAD5289004.1 Amino acid ABC transporter membrane protein 1, PAAT family [Bosea sp. 7B]CAD5300333.1 Amino acid ABC transporter membrane protein 1, PAAT family [Bosea sp. 21B]CAD5300913.1 Amino acid ABC transporter membrane protein 1, PAAT family [Bosea sp. 46]VVT62035.1 Amino acid ABC transporter membrane protein 1, PAAT family [Bosea sp. EC-HK365B]VXB51225.1 Amino acid ABC transporter membrane protein 